MIIDEIQRLPGVVPVVALSGWWQTQTGSVYPDWLGLARFVERCFRGLAGRAMYAYLHPIMLSELPASISMRVHWLRGGFPTPLTLKNNELRVELDGLVHHHLYRTRLAVLFDVRFSPVTMRKLWQMLAHVQTTSWMQSNVGNSAWRNGNHAETLPRLSGRCFYYQTIATFFVASGKRLVKAPKIYINDSGILHFLLNIKTGELNHPSLGHRGRVMW